MKLLGAIAFLFLFYLSIQVSASPICHLCGKPITGSYIQYETGEYYCTDCQKRYEHCERCGRPSASLAFVDNKKICGDCLAKSSRCGICGEPIIGRYTNYPEIGLSVCERCMATVPKCDFCGRPDKNLRDVGDKKICNDCMKKADLCFICGQPIVGQYGIFEEKSDRKYCQRCIAKYPKCSSCGAPVGLSGNNLDDGRCLCSSCYASGLFRADQISAIKTQTLNYLSDYLGMNISHKITYTLQGEDFIKEKSHGLSGDLNGLFYRKGDKFDIYVLYGLRRDDLYQVLAHEIAHAWMSENAKSERSLEESEGFAQWVAYHFLGYLGLQEQQRILLAGDDVYASGLRMMIQLENERGKRGVMDYITR